MKTSVIVFNSPEKQLDVDYISAISRIFYSGGFSVETFEVLAVSDDLGFKRRISELKDTSDVLIIADGERVKFNLKKIVAEVFETELLENENARKFLDAVITSTGVKCSDDFAVLPVSSTLIPNISGAYQGFLIDDEQVTLVVLPENLQEFSTTCEKYVIPYLANKFNVKPKRQILKFLGDGTKLYNVLKNARDLYNTDFTYTVTENCADYTVDLLFRNKEQNEDSNVIRYVVSELKDDIYAEFETSPEERLFDLLKLKKQRLSVAESFTGGRIASSMIKNSGVSEFFHEAIVAYSNKSKIERLGVNQEDLNKSGAVSSIVAYQMSAGLLKSGNCDLSIATTGIAGPKSDNTDKPVGLCYIAVGMKDGVHTYKYNLKGTREEITEQAKNIALGLAIKKLKKL
ncbi:MAG: nicotinamide-nucleotide amidohydrolase family protein [Clostridia bacterium]|nr:nicotinamide-nucleotide amidohydrolase family protein [Clostridia bacterium]